MVRGDYRVNTEAPVKQHGNPLPLHRRGRVASGDFLSVFYPYRQNRRQAVAATTRKYRDVERRGCQQRVGGDFSRCDRATRVTSRG